MAADEFDRALLFAAYRMAQVPVTARRDRVLERLHEPGDRPVFLPLPRRAPVRGVPLRVVLLAAAAAVLAVLGLELVSGGLAVRFDRTPAVQAVDTPKPATEVGAAVEREEHVAAPARRDAPVISVPEPPALAEPVAVVPPSPPVQSASAPRRKDVARVEVVARLEPVRVLSEKERELAMIANALAALDRRAWAAAADVLAGHAREFPRGAFAKEREALEIVVDCRREKSEKARLRARDFIVHTALSPHKQRIVDACRASAVDVADSLTEPRGSEP